MVRRAVDDVFQRVICDHVRVVDQDGPHVNDDKEPQIQLAVHREDEDEKMVWDGLRVPVHWVERM